MNLGVDISDKLNFSVIANYYTSASQSFTGSLLFNGLNYAPTFGVDEEDATNFLGIEVVNPLSLLKNTFGENNGNGLEGNFKLSYKPIDGLTVTSRLGYKIYNEKQRSFTPIQSYGNSKVYNQTQSSVYQFKATSTRVNWETFATYEKTFGEDHNTAFTLGTSVQNDLFDGIYQIIGIPITFDYFHHKFNTGGMTEEEALKMAAITWPDGIAQCCHYSESRQKEYLDESIRPQAHSDLIYEKIQTYGLKPDIVVEAKSKEQAIFKRVI